MDLLILKISTLFFYGSLALELTVWHVPSIASSRGILASENEIVEGYSSGFQKLFLLPVWKKIIFFVLPLGFVYMAYLYPLQIIFGTRFGMIPIFEPTAVLIYLSCLLIVLGRMLCLFSVWRIRKNNKQEGDSFELHTGGVFGRFRNPGLIGLYTSFFGFWLALPQPFFAFCILVYIAHMHGKILMEEDFLRNKFGVSYDQYCSTTNRYI